MLLTGALAATFSLTSGAAASADIMIRQVHPDNQGMFDAGDWVELQFTASGETLTGKHIRAFYPDGALRSDFTFPSNPVNNQSQRTVLISNTSSIGGTTPDYNVPLISTGTLVLGGQDGGVCLTGPDPGLALIDCVAYGAFTGTGIGTGTPATATPFGQTLERTIARGCATAIDGADDTNNSVADFVPSTNPPRNNSVTPTEKVCPGGGGSGKAGRPNTKIKKRPKNRSADDSPTFKFKSTESGSKFRCKLDKKPFKKCRSPKTYHGLDAGPHTFKVKATDADGNVDKTPAKDKFTVLP